MIPTIILASAFILNVPGEGTITYTEVQDGIYAGSDGTYLKELPHAGVMYPYKPKLHESHPQDAGNPYQWSDMEPIQE